MNLHTLKLAVTVLFGAILLAAESAVPAQGETVVIVSKQSAIAQLSEVEVKAIFLGKMTKLPSGTDIHVLLQDATTAVHAEFLDRLLAKTDAQFKSLWARRVFTGAVTPPLQLTDDRAVLDHIARVPGSIGYVSHDAVTDSVRVVYTIK